MQNLKKESYHNLGVVRDTAGYAVALNYSMSSVFGISEGDVWWVSGYQHFAERNFKTKKSL